ncbi:MAG: cytochrome c oxidase subunit III [Chloroflexi bacterium AL-W]|nr:cytochrome c oxidase subunit III [Chloroflexi bacterium AL-W]
MTPMTSTQRPPSNQLIDPQKFALWLFIITVIMIFGGMTSAYIVDRGNARSPLLFDLPVILTWNLALVLLSSIPMQVAVSAIRHGETRKALWAMGLTLAMGVTFLVGQSQGMKDMVQSGIHLVNNNRGAGIGNSGSFFFVFVLVHGAHIVGGVLALLITLVNTARGAIRPARIQNVYEMVAIFWHFLGILWLYLYWFLHFTQD